LPQEQDEKIVMPSGVGTLVSALLLASVISPGPAFALEDLYRQVFASAGKTMLHHYQA